MKEKTIIFISLLFTLLLSACSLVKRDNKKQRIEELSPSKEEQVLISQEKELYKVLRNRFHIRPESNKQSTKKEINKVFKNNKLSKNLKGKFYFNFSAGYTNLKNYDVYNTSTNKATWDDRYTKLGSSYEFGFGYDFGKIRAELSYAHENGRFDEYLTYFDKSITKIDSDRGILNKDFYLINAFYDFRNNKRFSPFFGLGFGILNSAQESAPFIPAYTRQVSVLQLKGGLSYELSQSNILFIEVFHRNANSHTTNDGLGTQYIYEAKDGFDSSGMQIGFRKTL